MKIVLYRKMKDKKKMELYLKNYIKDPGKNQRAVTNRRMVQLLAVLGGVKFEKEKLDRV